MTGYDKFKSEQEAFDLRCTYERELHSNGNGLVSLGFMTIMAVVALASCELPKEPVCVKKGKVSNNMLIVKNVNSNFENER